MEIGGENLEDYQTNALQAASRALKLLALVGTTRNPYEEIRIMRKARAALGAAFAAADSYVKLDDTLIATGDRRGRGGIR